MEEPAWMIFQDRERGWSLEGMHRLGEGDQLTIYDAEGSILWNGVLEKRRRGWFGSLSPSHSEWHPEGVALEQWRAWFTSKPPLEADFSPARLEA